MNVHLPIPSTLENSLENDSILKERQMIFARKMYAKPPIFGEQNECTLAHFFTFQELI